VFLKTTLPYAQTSSVTESLAQPDSLDKNKAIFRRYGLWSKNVEKDRDIFHNLLKEFSISSVGRYQLGEIVNNHPYFHFHIPENQVRNFHLKIRSIFGKDLSYEKLASQSFLKDGVVRILLVIVEQPLEQTAAQSKESTEEFSEKTTETKVELTPETLVVAEPEIIAKPEIVLEPDVPFYQVRGETYHEFEFQYSTMLLKKNVANESQLSLVSPHSVAGSYLFAKSMSRRKSLLFLPSVNLHRFYIQNGVRLQNSKGLGYSFGIGIEQEFNLSWKNALMLHFLKEKLPQRVASNRYTFSNTSQLELELSTSKKQELKNQLMHKVELQLSYIPKSFDSLKFLGASYGAKLENCFFDTYSKSFALNSISLCLNYRAKVQLYTSENALKIHEFAALIKSQF